MQVHQVLVGAAFGDAVTNEALGLRGAIQQAFPGVVSEIWTRYREEGLGGVGLLSEFPAVLDPDAVVIFHSSIGDPDVGEFLDTFAGRIVVRYHNITPSDFFAPYAPAFAELLALGRRQLFGLRERCVLAVADSEYNRRELVDAGFTRTVSVPVHADVRALLDAPPPPPERRIPAAEGQPVVLFVGRVAPNKGHVRLLQAFHVLSTYHEYHAHLWMAGGHALPAYSQQLEQYRRELGLNCCFTGTVSIEELAYFYRRADVFLCLSEHEGFCVPLLEAMAFDVPVVALDRAAVPETLGGAGLLLPEAGPELVAEAVAAVLHDGRLRQELVTRGRRRLLELAPQDASSVFVEHLRGLLV